MKTIIKASLFSIMTLVTANALAEVAVIVHPGNSASLAKDDVERIYLGKVKTFPGGDAVTPLNLPEGHATRTEFDQTLVGKSPSQLKAFWSKQVFTGKGTPPDEVADAAAMKAKVSSDPSAVGYVDAADVDSSVRVVGTF
ncbi:phosphate ABC transporter substrate-binding protein [Hydrocarboniclastica marina]|uniref:Phosphate ABC transporter substrate-binding protein n=1 Tax=Hydrocarboniclastica marina TaxID=2259620 RepID=A0A4P7XJT6_9ALTE|nr:phosphate ABC transporter substrate-binding protein [Hydrocarboniclastica marina]QCF27085.1 phosphate ABC transporter substrate-binding protein [Hydrocarboniclastica marina]